MPGSGVLAATCPLTARSVRNASISGAAMSRDVSCHEEDKAADPVEISLFGADGIVE